jgi:hypothetical protein
VDLLLIPQGGSRHEASLEQRCDRCGARDCGAGLGAGPGRERGGGPWSEPGRPRSDPLHWRWSAPAPSRASSDGADAPSAMPPSAMPPSASSENSATPPMHHHAVRHARAMHGFHKHMAGKAALSGDTTAALNREELARIQSGNLSSPPPPPPGPDMSSSPSTSGANRTGANRMPAGGRPTSTRYGQ